MEGEIAYVSSDVANPFPLTAKTAGATPSLPVAVADCSISMKTIAIGLPFRGYVRREAYA